MNYTYVQKLIDQGYLEGDAQGLGYMFFAELHGLQEACVSQEHPSGLHRARRSAAADPTSRNQTPTGKGPLTPAAVCIAECGVSSRRKLYSGP